MNPAEFLAHVLPHVGPYCIARGKYVLKDGKKQLTFHHFPAPDIAAAAVVSRGIDGQHFETYFAVGSLIDVTPQPKKNNYLAVSREAANIHSLRSFFLDLDVGPGKYASQRDALTALIAFCATCQLPKPTITSSGGGLHVYWTVEDDMSRDEWLTYAQALKALTVQHQLRNDSGLIANAACVLRVVGTHNWKDPANPREVKVLWVGTPTPNAQFFSLLGLRTVVQSAAFPAPAAQPAPNFGPSNIDRHSDDPISPQALLDTCQALRYVANPFNQHTGTLPEPAWWMGVTFSASMTVDDGKMFAHAISSGDPRYNEANLDERVIRLRERQIGPPPCAKIREAFQHHPTNADCCNGCPHRDTIKSPAVKAHRAPTAPPIELIPATVDTPPVFLSDPPFPYRRTTKGIVIETADPKTQAKDELVISPYDMYPTIIGVNADTGLGEGLQWKAHLPHEGWITIDMPHLPPNRMGVALAQRGLFFNEAELSRVHTFMTAYTRHLQHASSREPTFTRLGFVEAKGSRPLSFVLGETIYLAGGTVESHKMPLSLISATSGGIGVKGDYNEWQRLVMLYSQAQMEPYRAYIYTSFASPLFHMTTLQATAICAVGETGMGKSTLLDACMSVWGDPAKLRTHGGPYGFTLAGVEAKASALFNLPMPLDDATEQNADDISSFIFNYSGGVGRLRSQTGGGVRSDMPRWANILMLTGNEDEYARMAGRRVDSQQHTMRLIQIEFANTPMSKVDGDILRAGITANFGEAGHRFIEYLVNNYDAVKRRVLQCVKEIDVKLGAKTEERYWTAWCACSQVASEICFNLNILPNFPISHDAQWMEQQILRMRALVVTHVHTPNEVLSEFLDACIANTLVISTVSGNIDNVRQEPRNELLIRHEIDNGLLFVSAQAFQAYCLKKHVSMGTVLAVLTKSGALLDRSTLRILGADTKFSKGNRVRCFMIDTHKLSGAPALAVSNPAPAGAPVTQQPIQGPALQAAVAAWHAKQKP